MKKGALSISTSAWQRRLGVATAVMSVIPLLTSGYLIVTYILPNTDTLENVLLLVTLDLILAVSGFVLLWGMVKTMLTVHHALEGIARGILHEAPAMDGAPEIRNIADSIKLLVNKLREDKDKEKDIARQLEDGVAERTAAIENTTRILRSELERRIAAEEALKDSNMRLSLTLTQLRAVQQKMIQNQRLDALQQTIRGLAHDLNNVFMPIIGLSDFLMRNPDTLNNKEETLAALKDIRDAGNDARKIVRSLREFYRPADTAELREVDVNRIVEKTISLTAPFWKEQMSLEGNTIEMSRNLGVTPIVLGNEAGLTEMVRNLIMNAAEAIQGKGTITVTTGTDDQRAVLEVADTGSGMNEETILKCMEPFFTTKGHQRLGLGLSVVHGTVKRHRGTIEIRSIPGQGTTVTIKLPHAMVMAGDTKVSDLESPAIQALMRILVIDDEVSAVKFLKTCLTTHGHSVDSEESGEAGIARFVSGEYDLVITDRALRDMNGDEITKVIKRINPAVPVILLTGFGDVMADEGEHPPGVDLILSKPASDGELCEAIAKMSRKG